MASTSVDVRRATPADLAFVSRDGQVAPQRIRRMIDEGYVYLAACNGEPVGYARIEHLWSKIPYLALIFVLEPHRRRGVGRMLLAAVAAQASAAGHPFLYSSSQANEPEPQDWHRHVGFTECGFIAGVNGGGVGETFFRMPLDESAVAG